MGEARRRKLAGEGPRPESVWHSHARTHGDRKALKELKETILSTAAHTVPMVTAAVTRAIKASGKEK